MPIRDANIALQAAVTKTADFNGTGVDLGVGGTGLRGLGVQIPVTAIVSNDGDESYIFRMEDSDDNVTFAQRAIIKTLASAAPDDLVPQVLYGKYVSTKRYHRLSLDVGGTTPSATYSADFVVDIPL